MAMNRDFKYLIKIFIGYGAYSEVYKVIRISDEKEYALKKVRKYNREPLHRLKWAICPIKRRKMP
jgi:serine/threonine protein kinase